MLVREIHIYGVRNLEQVKLKLHPGINVFVGANGSGKTSLLEGVYFLALGRSFRTSRLNNLISFYNDFASVSAIYSDKSCNKQIKISSVKYKNQEKTSKIGETKAERSDVATLTPTQIIHEGSSKLIFNEPDGRRKFLDWLVFYSHKDYQHLWREFNRALQQRNNILKKSEPNFVGMLNNLDKVFVSLSEKIKLARQDVWSKFENVWVESFNNLGLNLLVKPQIKLFSGWDGDLLELLAENRNIDQRMGFTGCGPHRADLQFIVQGKAAKDVLSRGQGKALSLAMILARSRFIKMTAERDDLVSVLLIDDLCAELDDVNADKIIRCLFDWQNDLQVFITGVDQNRLKNVLPKERCKWFKVSEGAIVEMEV